MGPITWLSIKAYADHYQVTGEQADDLFHHIQKMDAAFLKWQRANRKRKQEAVTPPADPQPKPPRRRR